MDRAFIRSLVEFCARQPKAREIFHETLRLSAELSARGRVPTDRELDALVGLIEARAAAEAEAATALGTERIPSTSEVNTSSVEAV